MRRYSERNDERGYDRDFDPSYDYAGDAGGSYRRGYRYDRGYLADYELRDYERGEFDRGGYAHRPKLRRRYGRADGPYHGRGPRGYRRSRERILEDVNDALTWNGDLDASDIEVEVQNGEVTLTGTVESRWAKRLAEDLAEAVVGVRDVHNRLTIRDETDDARNGTAS